MSIIYKPKGKAREYSPLAANEIKLYGNECLMDEFLVTPFEKNTLFD